MPVPFEGTTSLPKDAGNLAFGGLWDGSNFYAPRGQAATGQGHVLGLTCDGTNLVGYIDSGPASSASSGVMTSCSGIGIGANPISANNYANVYLGSVLLYNRVLSAGELAQLVGYLRRRYGI